MSYEKGMKIYDAVTEINDETVEQAADYKFRRPPMRFVKPMGIAAGILLVAGIGTFAALNRGTFKDGRGIDTAGVPNTTPPETIYNISHDTTPPVTIDDNGLAVMTTSPYPTGTLEPHPTYSSEFTWTDNTVPPDGSHGEYDGMLSDTTTDIAVATYDPNGYPSPADVPAYGPGTADTTAPAEITTAQTTEDLSPVIDEGGDDAVLVTTDNGGDDAVVVTDGDDENPGGGGGPLMFRDYPVPVLPLTAGSDASGITVGRDLTFDFSEMLPVATYDYSVPDDELGAYTARDSYTLTNTTDTDKKVTLMYPFMSGFGGLLNDPNDWDSATVNEYISCNMPTVTVDGKAVNTTLIAGDYSGKFSSASYPEGDDKSNLDEVWDPQWYYDLLKDGSYLKDTLADRPVIDEPVVVYRIYDCQTTYDTVANDTFVTAKVSFTSDKDAEVNAFGWDRGYGRNGSKVEFEFTITNRGVNSDLDKYIVVRGGDISEPKFQGYYMDLKSKDIPAVKTDEISYKIERYEANYGDILPTLIMSEIMHNDNLRHVKYAYEQGVLTEKTICDAAIKYMCRYGSFSEHPIERYEWWEDIKEEMCDAVASERINYVTFDVTVPAGGSVTVNAEHLRYCNVEFGDNYEVTYCAGMYPAVGSTLDLTSVTARALLPDGAVITEDDIWAGASPDTAVELDPNRERYRFKFGFEEE